MNHRCAVAQSAVLALVLLVPVAASGQAAASAAAGGESFRTPWGDPDLQGTWTNTTTTPLQRPADLADKAFLTAEEHAVRDQRVALSVNLDNRYPEGDPQEPTSVGAYNNYWMERGTLSNRTSLIVDPPDGRLPPMTPEEAALQGRGQCLHLRQQPLRLHRGFQRPGPLYLAGHARGDDAGLLQPQLPDPADARLCRRLRRDGARRPHHPAGRASEPARGGAAVDGRFTWPLGGRYAGRRIDELRRQGERPAGAWPHPGRRHGLRRRRQPAPGGALHPRGQRTPSTTSSPSTIRRYGKRPGPPRCP